jgi:hypothetical protein
MIANSALLLLLRSVSLGLLVMVRWSWVVSYLAADLGLYWLYRTARCDVTHWVPAEGTTGYLETVIERTGVKMLVNFTGVIQFRAPAEMGGVYWCFDMVRGGRRTPLHRFMRS